MQMEVWHITGNGFHFGRHGLEQEESGVHLPSDSLFAAFVARMVELLGKDKVEIFCGDYLQGKPPFVLSSTFPRAGEVLFFPPPMSSVGTFQSAGPRPKKLKRVAYVSLSVFRELLAGKTLAEVWKTSEKIHDDRLLLSKEDAAQLPEFIRTGAQDIWKVERRPRVTLGRAAQNSSIYHTGRTVFNESCGLWFGLRWLNKTEQISKMVEELFLDLGDAGLGGDRSSGFGACKIESQSPLNLPDMGTNHWVTLGRYLPRDDEMSALNDSRAAYTIESVGGWIGSPKRIKAQRRRTIRLLTEGSVLGGVERDVPGQMVDVQPDYNGKRPLGHPVWRNGMALAVGLEIKPLHDQP